MKSYFAPFSLDKVVFPLDEITSFFQILHIDQFPRGKYVGKYQLLDTWQLERIYLNTCLASKYNYFQHF